MPNPDLVVRVAGNIAALQSDLATAVSSLKNIETATTGAKSATEDLAGSFDGLGHMVERLTERFAIYEVLRGALDFTKEILADAAAFEDLSRATGIGAEALQKLSYVGTEFGVTTEVMGRGVETLSARLASGDASATKAVGMLGLSVKNLMAAGPLEAFLQIADATGKVQDPMMKAALASDEFGGKLARVLLPSLGDLRTKMEEVPQGAIISEATIKSAHDFEVGVQHVETELKAYAAEVLAGIANGTLLINGPGGFNLMGQSIMAVNAALRDRKTAIDMNLPSEVATLTNAELLSNRLQELRTAALEPLTEVQKSEILELQRYGVALKEIAQLTGASEAAIKSFTDATKADEAAAKKAAETKQRIEAETALLNTKVWSEYFDKEIAFYGTDVQRATAAADRRYDVAVAEAQKKGIVDQHYYDGLEARRQQDIEQSKIDGNALAQNSIEALQATYDRAQATFNAMQVDGLHHSQAQIQHFRDLRDKALDALHDMGDGFTTLGDHAVAVAVTIKDSFAAASAAIDKAIKREGDVGGSFSYDMSTEEGRAQVPETIARWLRNGYSFEQAVRLAYLLQYQGQGGLIAINNDPTLQHPGPRVPGFALGTQGFQDFGSGTLAMLHGREAIVREDSAGVGAVHVTVNVAGNLLGTQTQLAAVVGDALMARLKSLGMRLPLTGAA